MKSSQETDTIDLEDLIKEFQVINLDLFATYLAEVWKVKLLYLLL